MQHVRFGSVLGRIGLAWFAALAISLYFGRRGRWVWFAGLLLGYWAVMKLVPVPGYGAGDLSQGKNLCDWLDQRLLPGRLYLGNHDPEGLLSTIPAIGTALLGVMAGDFVHSSAKSAGLKACWLVIAGIAAIGIALAWDAVFPINKNLWSSSFVLMSGGLSLILLAIFHGLMEGCGWRFAGFFFTVIGMNAIAIYVATEGLIDFHYTAKYLFGGAINAFIPASNAAGQSLSMAIGTVGIEWICLWFLWRKKAFIKV